LKSSSSRFLSGNVNRSKIKTDEYNISVKFSKLTNNVSPKLTKLYDIKKYIDPSMFSFGEEMQETIPKGTPPYLDNGERYVERMARALSFFKQCALIGPSGTSMFKGLFYCPYNAHNEQKEKLRYRTV